MIKELIILATLTSGNLTHAEVKDFINKECMPIEDIKQEKECVFEVLKENPGKFVAWLNKDGKVAGLIRINDND